MPLHATNQCVRNVYSNRQMRIHRKYTIQIIIVYKVLIVHENAFCRPML